MEDNFGKEEGAATECCNGRTAEKAERQNGRKPEKRKSGTREQEKK